MLRELILAGEGMRIVRGMESAFGFYLATSSLPWRTRKLLHTALFLRHQPWRHWLRREALREYGRLFPSEYPWWRLSVLEPRIWGLVADGIRFRVRRRLEGWRRAMPGVTRRER